MNYKQVFDSIDVGMVVLDQQFMVLEWNNWMALQSGIEAGEVVGVSIFQLFPELNNPIFFRNCKVVLTFGNIVFLSQKLHNYLFAFKVKGPRAAMIEYMQQRCTIMPLRADDGAIKNILITVQDVTESVALVKKRKKTLQELEFETEKRKKAHTQSEKLNVLRADLLITKSLNEHLDNITDSVIDIFNADFARIWLMKTGDLCDEGCIHAEVRDGASVCVKRDQCLHLMSSSGRYTHLDGKGHCRVPFGSYKIGKIAAAEEGKLLISDVVHDPNVHDPAWAEGLGLVAFAGYRILSARRLPVGVLALFSKHDISTDDDALLEGVANTTAHVVLAAQAEEALVDREVRYRSLFENARDAIMILDPSGVFVGVNPATLEMFGFENEKKIINQTLVSLSPDIQSDGTFSSKKLIKVFKKAFTEGGIDFEWLHKRSNGGEFYAHVRLTPIQLNGERMMQAAVRDISGQKKLEEDLKRLSSIDALTGVANRRTFDETLKNEWQRLARSKKTLSVLMCDVDYFKLFNDTYGHQRGDDVLRQISGTMMSITKRSGDLPARYGGEEFTIILPETEASSAVGLANKLCAAVENLGIENRGSKVSRVVTLSVGVASIMPKKDILPERLIEDADKALYSAKNTGRNRVVCM